jgi:very-short-patch-repair endonuclease
MATTRAPTKRTPIEEEMARQLREAGLSEFRRNARFVAGRRYEADFWFPELRLALEVDGGVFLPRGGHTSGVGYTNDRERDVEATLQGILTVRYTSEQVKSGYAIETFQQIYRQRRDGP